MSVQLKNGEGCRAWKDPKFTIEWADWSRSDEYRGETVEALLKTAGQEALQAP